MRKIQRWVYLVLAVWLCQCGEKPQTARNSAAVAANLSSDVAHFAERFAADSARTRLVILLSPT